MQKIFWTKTWVVVGMTFICCLLWGSAFPCIKVGYRLFSIRAEDTASQILFAGIRFFLAGLLVILFGSLIEKRALILKPASVLPALILSAFQTTGQYVFFYIGMAHTTGVKSSIMVAAGTFFTILISVLVFRYEKLTARKVVGCLIGFAGVVLIQLPGGIDRGFRLNGEGCILISTVFAAFAVSLVKWFSANEDPLALCAWQFLAGGAMLGIGGLAAGGRITGFTPGSVLLLLYMAVISAGAFSLSSVLLKYNPVSRIAVFRFMNPVIGVILSALILGEQNQAFTAYGLGSLILVSAGIIIVNRTGEMHIDSDSVSRYSKRKDGNGSSDASHAENCLEEKT